MHRFSKAVIFAGLSVLWCGVSASAETLRCQSVNGNVNCAGSSGHSCQTVNGKTTCTSGHGDVVQSFGGGSSRNTFGDSTESTGDQSQEDEFSIPELKKSWGSHVLRGHSMLPQSDETKLQDSTD